MAECSRGEAEGAAGDYLAFERWSNRPQTLFSLGQQPGVSLPMAVIGCGDWKVEFGSRKHDSVLPHLSDDIPGSPSDINSSKPCTHIGNLYKMTG